LYYIRKTNTYTITYIIRKSQLPFFENYTVPNQSANHFFIDRLANYLRNLAGTDCPAALMNGKTFGKIMLLYG